MHTIPNVHDIKKIHSLLLLILFFLSGVSSLIFQVVWTRMLTIFIGNTLQAVGIILGAGLIGFAVGSYFWGKYVDEYPTKLIRLFALLEIGLSLYAFIFPVLLSLIGSLYTGLSGGLESLEGNIVNLFISQFVLCLILIAIPSFLVGGTFPVILKKWVQGKQCIGPLVGLFTGLYSLGAVLGSLLCGFFFPKNTGAIHHLNFGSSDQPPCGIVGLESRNR